MPFPQKLQEDWTQVFSPAGCQIVIAKADIGGNPAFLQVWGSKPSFDASGTRVGKGPKIPIQELDPTVQVGSKRSYHSARLAAPDPYHNAASISAAIALAAAAGSGAALIGRPITR